MFKYIGSIVCFLLVSPVFTHYIFDDNPNGYLSAANNGEDFGRNRMPPHKKFYKASNNQNLKLLNERIVDSHFKMRKPSPSTFADVSMNTLIPIMLRDISSINHRQLKMSEINVINSPRKMENKFDDDSNNFKRNTYRNEIQSNPMRNDEMYYAPTEEQDTSKGMQHENQRNVKINHYKFQIASDNDKKGSISNENPQANSPEHKKTQISDNEERTLLQIKTNKDRNSKRTSRLSESQRSNINSLKQDENRKRDFAGIEKNYSQNPITKESEKFVSFNGGVKKFQQGLHLAKHNEEKYDRNLNGFEPARNARYNIRTKAKNKPYALFYVMNRENFDEPNRILSGEVRSYDQDPLHDFYNSVTNYKHTDRRNQNIRNYAVFGNR